MIRHDDVNELTRVTSSNPPRSATPAIGMPSHRTSEYLRFRRVGRLYSFRYPQRGTRLIGQILQRPFLASKVVAHPQDISDSGQNSRDEVWLQFTMPSVDLFISPGYSIPHGLQDLGGRCDNVSANRPMRWNSRQVVPQNINHRWTGGVQGKPFCPRDKRTYQFLYANLESGNSHH